MVFREGRGEVRDITELSRKEVFSVLLGMFGSQKTRANFVMLCQSYWRERYRDAAQDGENSVMTRRSEYHNAIMATIERINSQIKEPTELQQQVLRRLLGSREEVAQCAKAYLYQ